ncbi:MAG: M18 family aminopeptidase [Lachnospiraceae bacterium]
MYEKITKELISFIEKSPSCYHVIYNMKEMLIKKGFMELMESEAWILKPGGNYFVIRGGSSIIAFKIPEKEYKGFQIIASHSDFPTFKIKEHAEIETEHQYTKLNVEKYGGVLCAPWFDRPLSVAGRIMVKEEGKIITKLIDVDRDLVLIPSLAIHLNREGNVGYKYKPQVDLLPLYGGDDAKDTFLEHIGQAGKVESKNILSTDLFLYNRMKACIWGAKKEFISSARLDDLQCAFASLTGFLKESNAKNIAVHCVLDNEEVGSTTKQGAASTFLKDILQRINRGMGRTEEAYHMSLAKSFMLSADNAHAVHPNQMDKADPTNRPYLNGGVVIKYSANQKYTTDAVSAAIFKDICTHAKVPCQSFANRSDMPGGSTLGNIANTQVSIHTVDIGAPQLAMHSPYETSGIKDTYYLTKAAEAFFRSDISIEAEQCSVTYEKL